MVVRAYSVDADHLTVVKITRPGGRRKCGCGCGKRVTHYLAANGCSMGSGCEWKVWRRLRSLRPNARASASNRPECGG